MRVGGQLRRAPLVAVAVVALAGTAGWRTAHAFNPQPDPPGFGLVGIMPDQIVRLNVVCYEHPLGATPPDPCRGELMFHDAAGNVVAHRFVELQPGHAAHLSFSNLVTIVGDVGPGSNRMSINPCVIPAPESGRMIPSVEIIDATTGRTTQFINNATPRMSFFAQWRADVAASSGR